MQNFYLTYFFNHSSLNRPFVYWVMVFIAMMSLLASMHAAADIPASDQEICETVSSEAERAFSLPAGILRSIAQVESGRKTTNGNYRSWPWTINDNGKGLFFDTRQSAVNYIKKQTELDNSGIDIGCMQISVKWHSEAFSSPESIIDPYTNIAYAAMFLEELYQTHGEWDLAIKHYHSADSRKNVPYLQKVNAVWKNQPEPLMQPFTASTSFKAAAQMIDASADNASSLQEARISKDSDARLQTFYASDSPKEIRSAPNQQPQISSSITEHQDPSLSKPTDKFVQTQPHLAKQWDKVVHFRKLFSNQ